MNTRAKIITGLIGTAGLALLSQSAPALAMEWETAPLNPRFEALQQQRAFFGVEQRLTDDGHALGYMPGPIQLPRVKSRVARASEALPPGFDLRKVGGVTPIRDQGNCGSCWAFATFGSLESYLKYRQIRTWNLSEQDLNQRHGFDHPECEGGTHLMSTAYLARWSGPVTEQAVPYPYADASDAALPSAAPAVAIKKHIQEVWFLPPREGFLDNDAIKTAVMQTGGVFMAFEMRGDAYNEKTFSFYTDSNNPNHAVVIVGWDDEYPDSKFLAKKRPPGNGAFIVRNSWGEKWGDKGYFYLSYYDRSVQDFVAFHNADKVSNYTQVYEYDPLGWTQSIGVTHRPQTFAWFANIFTVAPAAPVIHAVSFYTPVPDSRYVIFIYDQLKAGDPVQGQRILRQTGTLATAGYHTVRLNTDVVLTPRAKFSAVVKLATPGYRYPVPIEARVSDYSSAASANTGQSFVSADGVSWEDLNPKGDEKLPLNLKWANVALKAFGSKPTVP